MELEKCQNINYLDLVWHVRYRHIKVNRVRQEMRLSAEILREPFPAHQNANEPWQERIF